MILDSPSSQSLPLLCDLFLVTKNSYLLKLKLAIKIDYTAQIVHYLATILTSNYHTLNLKIS